MILSLSELKKFVRGCEIACANATLLDLRYRKNWVYLYVRYINPFYEEDRPEPIYKSNKKTQGLLEFLGMKEKPAEVIEEEPMKVVTKPRLENKYRATTLIGEVKRVLGLDLWVASERAIKAAYRVKSNLYHPDTGGSHAEFVYFSNLKDKALNYINYSYAYAV